MFWNNHLFNVRHAPLLGIDINDQGIHGLLLDRQAGKYIVKSYVSEPLSATEGEIITLRKLKQPLPNKIRFIATALPVSKIISKEIPLPPNLNHNELENFLLLNVEKHLGCSLADINMDYQIEDKSGDNTKVQHIKVIAARKEDINSHIASFKGANLEPKFLDVDLFALARSAQLLANGEEPLAILNIDEKRLLLGVLLHEQLIYSDANYFPQSESTLMDIDFLEEITISLQKCFFKTQILFKEITLSGTKVNFKKILEEKMDVKVNLANPFTKFDFATSFDKDNLLKNAAALMITLGLAMREFTND